MKMPNKFIETVLSIPSEEEENTIKALININHICFLQENKSDKTTWIITDGRKYHDILHSLECYQALKNQILDTSKE